MAATTPSGLARNYTSTVPTNGTLGNPIDLGIFDSSHFIVGTIIKGTVVSTTMTFNVSHQSDGITFFPLMNESGSAVQLTIASNTAIGHKQDIRSQFGNWRFVQPVMGSTETGGATILFEVQ